MFVCDENSVDKRVDVGIVQRAEKTKTTKKSYVDKDLTSFVSTLRQNACSLQRREPKLLETLLAQSESEAILIQFTFN